MCCVFSCVFQPNTPGKGAPFKLGAYSESGFAARPRIFLDNRNGDRLVGGNGLCARALQNIDRTIRMGQDTHSSGGLHSSMVVFGLPFLRIEIGPEPSPDRLFCLLPGADTFFHEISYSRSRQAKKPAAFFEILPPHFDNWCRRQSA